MYCYCAEFIVKYVLFIANLAFSVAGVTLIGLGIAVLMQVKDIEILQEEVAVQAIPISVIVLGAVIFIIAFLGCCGAITESRCLLFMYSVVMMLLAAGKLYLAIVLFQGLSDIYDLVEGWIGYAFNSTDMRQAFHLMESAFKCCGTTGPESYTGILPALPASCCTIPQDDGTCARVNAYIGCNSRISGYFQSYGGAIGGVILGVIAVEIVALIFGLFLCCSIGHKRKRSV